ncbi:hypothetical protein D0Y65_036750 [Glycine soja]|uniref:Replication factor A C-terminal domain-containing protein n=1 Tax=Glycine soja TaxID=3848 RepID=A0A445HGA5_GLYSO|nr:hypothetical protein D0Y65_036750 [Glycine soja]
MACLPDKIKSIDGSREALKLIVRITDLWFIGIPHKIEQAEMVIVDSDGDEIHVVCKQDQLKVWKADLKENCIYFRVCDHQYKLAFTGVTIVRQSDLDHLPFRQFKFVDFSAVIADVIGVVDEVVFRYVSSKNTRVVLKFKDLSGQILSCTLWGDYCLQFLAYLDVVENNGPVVILLTYARIKEAEGSYPPSVSNSLKASKLMINELVMEKQEFKERLVDSGIEVRSVLTLVGQGASENAFLSKSEAKTICQINAISEEIVCVTVGTITRIVMDNHSWCYPTCSQCHKKIDMPVVSFTCSCGKHNDLVVLRYRVEVMVEHGNESTKFLLWDCECAELIGQSADEVNRLKIEDGDVDLNVSPQVLDRLLGCLLAFKVKVQPKFGNAVVLKYSPDLDLINFVLDMLPDIVVVLAIYWTFIILNLRVAMHVHMSYVEKPRQWWWCCCGLGMTALKSVLPFIYPEE